MDFPRNLPEDIKAELLLSYLPSGSFKVAFKGIHKRNAYNDIVDMDKQELSGGQPIVGLARNSIYHSLPEYVFHPVDRFNNLSHRSEDDPFAVECEKQKQEIELALRFFAPHDLLLLLHKVECREWLRTYSDTNRVLIDILGDELTERQRNNRFVKATMDFLPFCKQIRGDKTLLTILLRKIFIDEGIHITPHVQDTVCRDDNPRYDDGLDSELCDGFLGNVFDEQVNVYDIHYWDDEACDSSFLEFVEEVEEYQHFVEHYFLSVEECLHFDITTDAPPLLLSDDIIYNYLDYNTNI